MPVVVPEHGERRQSVDVTAGAPIIGGVHAVADIDFTAAAGKVTSLIGPNGAGKTTLINLFSGLYRAETGTIMLGEQPLTGRAPHAIARAGIARTFQTSQLFAGLSVLDNVRVGLRGHRLGRPIAIGSSPTSDEKEERQLAESLLAFVGYGGALDRPADDLAHVDKRLAEIARALATTPKVLLLDERQPASAPTTNFAWSPCCGASPQAASASSSSSMTWPW